MINYAIVLIFISIFIAFCVIDFKGRLSGIIMLVLMYLLMAYVTMNADMSAYIGLYDNINGFSDVGLTDPGFSLMMLLGKKLNLDYYGFLNMITILGLLLLAVVIYKKSQCPAIVLALYFIFVFPAETIQIRAFFAEIILYILMLDMINREEFKLSRFLVLMLLAVIMHATSLFFVLLLLAVFIKDRRKLTIIMGVTIFAVPVAGQILSIIPIPMIQAKLQPYFSAQRESVSIASLVYILLYIALTVYIYWTARRETKFRLASDNENFTDETEKPSEWERQLDMLLRIHIICALSCMMILFFSSNFYRITRTVMVVDFIVLGNHYLQSGRLKTTRLVIAVVALMALFVGNELMSHSLQTIMEYNPIFSRLIMPIY